MRLLILFITLFLYRPIFSQFLKPELECYFGAYYYSETEYDANSYDLKRYGLTTNLGVRMHLNLTKHFSIIPGFGIDKIYVYYSPYLSEVFVSLYAGYKTSPLKSFPYARICTSIGIEIEPGYGAKIPLTFGVENELSETVNWTLKAKLPTLIDTKLTELYDYTEIGFEMGLKVWLKSNKPPEPIHKYGNPFILQ